MSRVIEILEDVTSSLSAKRIAFFVLLVAFLIVTFAVLIHKLPPDLQAYASTSQEKISDLLKWLGGFIASEHLPTFGRGEKPHE